jgi:hypothetical protein
MQTLTETKLVEIFVEADDFLLELQRQASDHSFSITQWHSRFSRSEVMTVLVAYHFSGHKCLKYFYCNDILDRYKDWFPQAPCYPRFVALIPHVVAELYLLLRFRCQPALEQNYVDSKPMKVCHIKREGQHKVMADWARKGKGSLGWFYGFKLHAVIRSDARLSNFMLTPGNVADNNHDVLRYLLENMQGKVYGDKGYLSKLKAELLDKGVDLIAKLRSNGKKGALVAAKDAYYLRHRGLVETVFGLWVGLIDLEHTRHRAPINYLCNTFGALLAYSFSDNYPTILPFEVKDSCLKAA